MPWKEKNKCMVPTRIKIKVQQQRLMIMIVQESTQFFWWWTNWLNNTTHETKKITKSLTNLGLYANNEKRGPLVTTRD
jgi:hypothetical protein